MPPSSTKSVIRSRELSTHREAKKAQAENFKRSRDGSTDYEVTLRFFSKLWLRRRELSTEKEDGLNE